MILLKQYQYLFQIILRIRIVLGEITPSLNTREGETGGERKEN